MDPTPIYSNFLKPFIKLNKLSSLEIVVENYKSTDLSCVDNFVSSPRTKKTLTNLKSLKIDYARDYSSFQQDSPEFIKFYSTLENILSSLQSYSHPKSSLFLKSSSALVSILNHSPHLTSFTTQLDIVQDYTSLFDELETLDHLSSLKFIIFDHSRQRSPSLKNFGKTLVNLKELDLILSVSLEDANTINYTFIDALRFIPNLQQLTLKFNIANFDSDSFQLLAQSISSFSNLQSFKVTFYTHKIDLLPHGSQIPDLFKALGLLKTLKVLHLIFESLGQYLNNAAYKTLCDTLENLAELRDLKIEAQRSEIDDQAIIKLAKTLPKLLNLKSISIDLFFGGSMENDTLTQLLKSLTTLKRLGKIDLNLSCYRVELTTYETVILLLNKLRSLCFCRLNVFSSKKNPGVQSKFQELLLCQYQYQGMCQLYLR